MSDVVLRLRPRNDEKTSEDCLFSIEQNTILDRRNNCPFVFDSVYDGSCSTSQLYEDYVKHIVDGAIEGFHGTVFAYGQTGSGKTFTISGTKNSYGIIPLAITQVFNRISGDTSDRQYLLRVSYFEIYCEKITDLLSSGKEFLDVREDQNREPYVENLHEEIISSEEQTLSLLQNGALNRRTGATAMNNKSSRSHAVFRLIVESKQTDGCITMSHLNLVDLAGSEKVHQTKAEGQRFREGVEINQSLSTLNMVIKQITEKQSHVNYRGSKLTRILKNSIGGNSKTCIICTISPWDYEQSLSTLRFATNAKKIENHVKKNEIVPEAAMMKRLEAEMKRLESEIIKVRCENEKLKSYTNNTDLDDRQRKLEEIKLLILRGNISKDKAEAKSRVAILKDRRMTWAPSRISTNHFSLSPGSPLSRPPLEFAPPPFKPVVGNNKNGGKKVQFNCLPEQPDENSLCEERSFLQAVEDEEIPTGTGIDDQYTPLEKSIDRGIPSRTKLYDLGCTPLKTIEEQRTPQSKRRPSEFASTPYLIKQSEHVRQLVETTRSFFEKHRQLAESELNEMCQGLEFHFMESLVFNTAPKAHLFSPEVVNRNSASEGNLINFDDTFPHESNMGHETVIAENATAIDERKSTIISPFKLKLMEDHSSTEFPRTIAYVDQEVQTAEVSESASNAASQPGKLTFGDVAVGTEEDLIYTIGPIVGESGVKECKTVEVQVEILPELSEKNDLSTEKKMEDDRSEEYIQLREEVDFLKSDISEKELKVAASEVRCKDFDCIVSQQREEIDKLKEESAKCKEEMQNELNELQRQCEEKDFEMINVSQEREKLQRKLEEREKLVQSAEDEREQMKQSLENEHKEMKQKLERELSEMQQRLEQEREQMKLNMQEQIKQNQEELEELRLRCGKEREEMKKNFEEEREEMKQKLEEERPKLRDEQNEEILNQLASAREEVSMLEVMLQDAAKLYADAETKVEQLTAELATLEKIRDAKKSLEESVKVLEEKDREADKTLKRCIQTVLDEKAVLQKNLDSFRRRQFDMIAAGKKELREENDLLREKLEQLELKVPKLQKQLNEKTAKCEELERRMPMGPFTQIESETFEDLKNRFIESHEHYVRKKRECIALKELKEKQEKEIEELKEKLDTKIGLDMLDALDSDMDSSQILPTTSSSKWKNNTANLLTVQKQTALSRMENRELSEATALESNSADISFLN